MSKKRKRSRSSPALPASSSAAAVDANWKALVRSGAVQQGSRKRRRRSGSKDVSQSASENIGAKGEEFPEIDWTRRKASEASKKMTRIIGIDCEMVGVGPSKESRLAKVCLVNHRGEILYESFAKPMEKVTDFRTRWSGIRQRDLVDAPPFWKVQTDVADLVRGKILVGHQLKGDLEALILKHPKSLLRDTARYMPFRKLDSFGKHRASKLKELCLKELGKTIQEGEHDPYVDARAALELYKTSSKQWEQSIIERRMKRKRKLAAQRGLVSTDSEEAKSVENGHSEKQLLKQADQDLFSSKMAQRYCSTMLEKK